MFYCVGAGATGHAALIAVADLRSQRRQWTQLSGPRLSSRSHDMIAWTKLPSSLVTELYEEFVGKRGEVRWARWVRRLVILRTWDEPSS